MKTQNKNKKMRAGEVKRRRQTETFEPNTVTFARNMRLCTNEKLDFGANTQRRRRQQTTITQRNT